VADTLLVYAALCGSAFFAGAINAVGGGGTLLTFPALLAVVSPVTANGTSTVALVPGSLSGAWAYRQEVAHPPRLLKWLLVPSLVGGLIGTILVTRTEERYFAAAVPWLILVAAILLAVQPMVARLTGREAVPAGPMSATKLTVLAGVQLWVAVYGGYFGAGIGILMLSALAYMGLRDLHQMNALKTLLATMINGTSTAWFASEGKVDWRYALPMAVAAIAGGYAGARLSLRFPASKVRRLVTLFGFALAGYYLYKQYFGAA
jgi:hypothetical protein